MLCNHGAERRRLFEQARLEVRSEHEEFPLGGPPRAPGHSVALGEAVPRVREADEGGPATGPMSGEHGADAL